MRSLLTTYENELFEREKGRKLRSKTCKIAGKQETHVVFRCLGADGLTFEQRCQGNDALNKSISTRTATLYITQQACQLTIRIFSLLHRRVFRFFYDQFLYNFSNCLQLLDLIIIPSVPLAIFLIY